MKQHICLIFEPVAVNIHQFLHHSPGQCPKAGLGIGDGHAHEDLEYKRCDAVAAAASGRNLGQGEVPDAQGDPAPLRHIHSAGSGVLRVVLGITVYGDHTQLMGTVLKKPAEGGFQRGTFAPVFWQNCAPLKVAVE